MEYSLELPRSGHSITQNLIMRAEGPKKLSAGTSRKSRPEGSVAASYIYSIVTPVNNSHPRDRLDMTVIDRFLSLVFVTLRVEQLTV